MQDLQVQVQVHRVSLCSRVVQVGGVQVHVHTFSLCYRVVQVHVQVHAFSMCPRVGLVGAGAGAVFLPVL